MAHTNIDFDIQCNDIEEAYSLAETYTTLGFEVSTPRSYDNGKRYEFTVSHDC